MSLRTQLNDDVIKAMKDASAEGKARLGVLRFLLSAVKNEEIAAGTRVEGLNDEQMIAVVRREVKRRREAAEMYRSHKEEERARAEESEAAILSVYLPTAPDAAAVRRMVEEVIAELPAAQRNVGAAMKAVMAKAKGTVDGQTVRRAVEEALAVTPQ